MCLLVCFSKSNVYTYSQVNKALKGSTWKMETNSLLPESGIFFRNIGQHFIKWCYKNLTDAGLLLTLILLYNYITC